MPSQEVIEKLENLQAELFNISIAVKHVEDAATVAKTASEILKHIPGLLNDIKAIEEKHRN